jgi:hypothetical protein
VKQAVKIFVLSLVATMYCISVAVAINTSVSAEFSASRTVENEQGVITTVPVDYSHYLNRPNNLIVPAQTAESLPGKKDFSEFYHEIQVYQQNTLGRYVQYLETINNFPVNIRKTDGIFPFHYFW